MPAQNPPMPSPERVLEAIKDLPLERLQVLLEELANIAGEPRCAEAQADGVPCTSPRRDCAQCSAYDAFLANVRSRVVAELTR
jgi:hypothetical protein